jgi:UDP-GlcNAc:undecaprenyl-phosphate/decaprenyl-phosphate GlcNAc-1-phosphate transferase
MHGQSVQPLNAGTGNRATVFETIAFFTTLIALLALRALAPSLGLLDQPGGRKQHAVATPVVGGIAIYVGLLCGLLAMGAHIPCAVLLGMGLLFVVGGFIDDRIGLPPRLRFLKQLLFVLCLPLVLPWTVPQLGDLFGFGTVALGMFALPFTVLAIIALINGTNMLDGSDGLAGGCAAVGLAGLALVASWHGITQPLPALSVLLATLAAFLLFNLPLGINRRLRVFMGDAGSNFLGFALAYCALWILEEGAHQAIPPALMVWMLPLPVFEIFYTPVRRLLAGRGFTGADSDHWHHRLRAAGWRAPGILALYLSFSLASVALGLLLHAQLPDWTLGYGFVLWFLLWNLLLRWLGRSSVLQACHARQASW